MPTDYPRSIVIRSWSFARLTNSIAAALPLTVWTDCAHSGHLLTNSIAAALPLTVWTDRAHSGHLLTNSIAAALPLTVWTDRAHSGHLLTNSIAAALPTYGVDGLRTQRSLTDKLHCCGAAHLRCGRTAHTAVTY